jgi:hypothetical protein
VSDCPVIVAYLPDGRTPVRCMITTPVHEAHVAHVRRDIHIHHWVKGHGPNATTENAYGCTGCPQWTANPEAHPTSEVPT